VGDQLIDIEGFCGGIFRVQPNHTACLPCVPVAVHMAPRSHLTFLARVLLGAWPQPPLTLLPMAQLHHLQAQHVCSYAFVQHLHYVHTYHVRGCSQCHLGPEDNKHLGRKAIRVASVRLDFSV